VFERAQRWRGSKHPAREHALQLITGLAVVNLDERRRLGRLFGRHGVAIARCDGERAKAHRHADRYRDVDGPARNFVEAAQNHHTVHAVLVRHCV